MRARFMSNVPYIVYNTMLKTLMLNHYVENKMFSKRRKYVVKDTGELVS